MARPWLDTSNNHYDFQEILGSTDSYPVVFQVGNLADIFELLREKETGDGGINFSEESTATLVYSTGITNNESQDRVFKQTTTAQH